MARNFLPALDIISPKITLFYDGNKRYSTTIGGIFTIIVCCTGIFEFLNQLFSYINFDIKNILYYRKYFDEFGSYKLNIDKDSLFFYINFIENSDYSKNNKLNIDFSKVRLIGLLNVDFKTIEESYLDHEHWLLGNCDPINIDKELQKLSGNDFNKSICLNYFYNTKTKQYYSIYDKNFQSPNISHSSEYFYVYTYKCINNSITNKIYGNCSSEKEIIHYIENSSLVMEYNFLSHQVNSDNHKNPDRLIFNSITSKFQVKDTYTWNSVTFTPVIIEKEKNAFFFKTKFDQTFSYQDYKKSKETNINKNDILNLFSITFENLGHYYKYSYKTVYDIFEKLTIIIEVIHYVFYIVNYIYNLFIGNINIQNIIFHKKLPYTRKIRYLFSENYEFNLTNVYLKNNNIISDSGKSKSNSKMVLMNNSPSINESKENKISQKDSVMLFQRNVSSIEQLNNKNVINLKKIDANKSDYKYIDDQIFSKMEFSPKDILLFFKYLICNKWNNSPLLLFDSIQKKLISVEHLFHIHLLLLSLKKQRNRTKMIDIYKFFDE